MENSLKYVVEGRLAELDRNPFDAAKRVKLERGFINDILIGRKTSVRGSSMAKLAEALDWSLEELIARLSGNGTGTTKIRGLAAAGSDMVAYSAGDDPDEWVRAPTNATKTTVAVRLRGDSLGGYLDGWLAFYDEGRKLKPDELIGKMCVIELADGRVMVKKITRGGVPKRFTLLSLTQAPVYDAEVVWAAEIMEMRQT